MIIQRKDDMMMIRSQIDKIENAFNDIADTQDVIKTDGDIISYILENCEIEASPNNSFFFSISGENIMQEIIVSRALKYNADLLKSGLKDGEDCLAYTGRYDFSHTCPDFAAILALGFTGLKSRVTEYSEKYGNTPEKKRFYNNLIKVYDSVFCFLDRTISFAKDHGFDRIADGLESIKKNPPQNLFEAMQTMIVYYALQHTVEGTYVRTLGRLDKLLFTYYQKEKYREYADQLIDEFFQSIDTLKAPANIPLALGGTDINGNSSVNELTYKLLKSYHTVYTSNTKLHLMCSENTPDDLLGLAMDGVRKNKNSIVFIGDQTVIHALTKIGDQFEDAADYHIVGCYECGAFGELTCSCNGRVNIPKAIEVSLNNGIDMLTGMKIGVDCNTNPKTFDEFLSNFETQLRYFSKCAIAAVDCFEKHYSKIHSSPVFTSTFDFALKKGGDIYCDHTAKYNNSSINALGLGTAVDSLAAIKKLVYDDKTLTISELAEILKNNWKDHEELRLLVKNRFPKFGTADQSVDSYARKIISVLSDEIDNHPNRKGGIYRLGTFSIDWRWEFGKNTAASADGRLSGETISQNTSATFGADKLGATAHLISVAGIGNLDTPNGSICDIDLHFSAVEGENGLNALVSALKSYYKLGGYAVHFNILNAETLKKAKMNLFEYPNLQVRLCEWNVLFSSLSDQEKEEFIARADRGENL